MHPVSRAHSCCPWAVPGEIQTARVIAINRVAKPRMLEAASGVIEIAHSTPETVQRDTSTAPSPPKPTELSDMASASPPVASPEFHQQQADEEGVLNHVRVGVIADYYDIGGLTKLANSKILSMPSDEHGAQALLDATKEAVNATNDGTLHATMAALVAQNLGKLVHMNQMDDLIGDFGLKVLKEYVKQVEGIERELHDKILLLTQSVVAQESARVDADRAASRADRISQNIGRCIETLQQREYCRNPRCDAQFNCHIEQRGCHYDPTYTLRCDKCRCRH